MDIVLNTVFNNPRLARVIFPGFKDDFNRPAATGLGKTTDGKDWEYTKPGPAWSITSSGTARNNPSNSETQQVAYVDGRNSDGRITAVVARATPNDPDFRGGIAFRVKDAKNYVYLSRGSGTGVLTMYVRQNNSTVWSHAAAAGETIQTDDIFQIELEGSIVAVYRNGERVMFQNVPYFLNETKHGFMAFFPNVNTEWQSIEFTV